ncbi:ATP-binding protein [Streptomyces sp. NPDC016566]|uniref:ATP-binding protein n=1 Tax=Streptomyces sp. NPDC016566 TaxID=3364967 RepID=UPI00370122F3
MSAPEASLAMAAETEPAIVRSLSTELPGVPFAVHGARTWVRMSVTALHWQGDILQAVEVITRLVDNGVRHGMPADVPRDERRLVLSAAVTDTGELLIDVSDLNPAFRDFDEAVAGKKGRGLWHVARLGARVIRFLPHEGAGKTVRAVLPPGPMLTELPPGPVSSDD